MDNSKSYLPRYLHNSKELVGSERLPTKIHGAIIWSGFYPEKRKDLFFLNHDHYGKYLLGAVDSTLDHISEFKRRIKLAFYSFLCILVFKEKYDIMHYGSALTRIDSQNLW